jgi:hypothetical protein
MKKSIFIVAALAAFSFASCKKDYTCTCKSGSTELASYTINTTKKKSKDLCSDYDASFQSVYSDASCEVE